jgi:multidrug efflux pump subunit AcrA (membrane-fusion protein)
VRVPLVASQAGVVVRRSVEPGAQVLEAAELVAIVPWSSLVFEAHVPQSAQGRVRVGQRATIVETGRPSRPATVQRLLPAVDPADQSTLAWLTPSSSGPTPELDRFGTASIVVGTAHVALAVPDSAVVEDDLTGETRIAVVDSSRHARWTTVSLGAAVNGRHELRAPALAPGTPVVVEGHHGLPDGARVRWTP